MNNKNEWFNNARFGMFIHWGIYSIPAQGEWVRYHNDISIEDYDKYAEQFNPVDFDPAEWADIAWDAGMRYVVFTTKHHDGFCMYDSKHTDFKITNTPYGKDITAELVVAFRAKGLKIGFYHSLVDWRHPHYIPDGEHPDGKNGQTEFLDRDLTIYRDYLYKQVEQLLTDYGKIDLLFFDYTSKYKESSEWQAERLLELIYSLQPEILVNDRLSYDKTPVFYGDYCTPEISLPNQQPVIDGKAVDWETCMTLNNNWGYNATDQAFKDPNTVIRSVIHCASMNGNLLLNVGPDAMGKIPAETVEILAEVGEWFDKYEQTIYNTHATKWTPPVGCYYTAADEKTLYLHLVNPLMGDLILPQLNDKVKRITVLADGSEVTLVTFWGTELLKADELRIRPPKHLSAETIDVLKIELK
ncbi:MAG: alpha-L-fucosidase [Victivallaceae bacterium]|nr:alpha-L-fucosidase [Victivallaceae bacterium]